MISLGCAKNLVDAEIMSERVEELLSREGACCLAFTPKINTWNGRDYVDLVVEDLQAGGRARLG